MKTTCCRNKQYTHLQDRVVCINPDCSNYLASTHLEVESYKRWLVLLLILPSLLLLPNHPGLNHVLAQKNTHLYASLANQRIKKPKVPLTWDNLKAEIKHQNILCPEEVYAQIKLESGNLTSVLFTKTNNFMGMRYPCVRKTSAIGIYLPEKDQIILGTQKELKVYAKQNNYAVYETWQQAVSDYKLWQDQNFKLKDRYLKFLGSVYAEDSHYVSKVKQIAVKVKFPTDSINQSDVHPIAQHAPDGKSGK